MVIPLKNGGESLKVGEHRAVVMAVVMFEVSYVRCVISLGITTAKRKCEVKLSGPGRDKLNKDYHKSSLDWRSTRHWFQENIKYHDNQLNPKADSTAMLMIQPRFPERLPCPRWL